MDLTEIKFIYKLSGTAKTPCMAHDVGFFFSMEEAESALKRNWAALKKEFDYEEFWIDEVIAGALVDRGFTGVASQKWFEVTDKGLVEIDQGETDKRDLPIRKMS